MVAIDDFDQFQLYTTKQRPRIICGICKASKEIPEVEGIQRVCEHTLIEVKW